MDNDIKKDSFNLDNLNYTDEELNNVTFFSHSKKELSQKDELLRRKLACHAFEFYFKKEE